MFELKLFYTPIFLFGFYLYGYDIMRHPLVRNYSWIIVLMTVSSLFETHHKNEAILFYWVQSDPCIILRVFILILLTKFKRSYRTLMIYSTFCAFLRNSLFFEKRILTNFWNKTNVTFNLGAETNLSAVLADVSSAIKK